MMPVQAISEANRRVRNEAGFALPFTIFLVTIITIMLAAAFTRATADHQVASNSSTEVSALSIAQSGLQSFLEAGDTMSARPAPSDSFRFNVTGGYAWVYPELIHQPADTTLGFTYVVRSVGHVIHPSVGPDPQATRTIAQFARWKGLQLPALAALVALNGVDHSGGNHGSPPKMWFDGDDDLACPYPTGSTYGYRGPDLLDQGTEPGIHAQPTENHVPGDSLLDGTDATIAYELGIDWTAATTASILKPDYTTLQNHSDFPTTLINGDLTFDSDGTGLLVVTGDLTLVTGNIRWDGVILVGGQIIPVDNDGAATLIHGTVVTGLNRLNGSVVNPNPMTMTDPTLQIHYCSCSIHDSLQRFASFQTIDNTWIDNWATY